MSDSQLPAKSMTDAELVELAAMHYHPRLPGRLNVIGESATGQLTLKLIALVRQARDEAEKGRVQAQRAVDKIQGHLSLERARFNEFRGMVYALAKDAAIPRIVRDGLCNIVEEAGGYHESTAAIQFPLSPMAKEIIAGETTPVNNPIYIPPDKPSGNPSGDPD